MSQLAPEVESPAAVAPPLAPAAPAARRAWPSALGLRLLSVLLIFLLWELLSRVLSASVVPTPYMTWVALGDAFADGYVWSDLTVTFGRMTAAFALAMGLAIVFGIALGTVGWFGRMFDFWVTIAASIPSLLYIVVAYLWIGLNDTGAILAAALVVAPSATFNVWQGIKSIDPGLSEMARAFGLPRWTIIRRVLFPQTTPYLFAAARSSLALTWKIVIFVELMGRSTGVGYRINYWYQLFNMPRVLASAVLFLVVMLLIELVLVRNLERYLFRWRREEAQ